MPTVDLDELQGAVEWVSGGSLTNEAHVCRETGHVYWVPDELETGDLGEDAPDDIDDSGKYVLVPNSHELDLGSKLAFEFAARYLADQYDEVRVLFRRKGAFGRFKVFLHQQNLLEEWYAFSEEQTRKALENWCESEGLEVER